MFNPFPKKLWFLHVCSTSLLKTLWEKEILLVTSNFSFSCSVFHLLGELSAIPFPKQTLVFMCLQYTSFENTEGKGEIARNE